MPFLRKDDLIMRLPNGYGNIVKLGGDRRKPYTVRISKVVELPDGTFKRTRKYIAYFERKEDAIRFLTEYNNASVVPEHKKYCDIPTFSETYELWKKYKNSLKIKLSKSSWKNYEIAFNHFADVHILKISNIKTSDLQNCLNKYNSKSKSTIGNMRALLNGMYSYALMQNLVSSDPTQFLKYESTNSTQTIHSRFSDDEINTLWKKLYVINNVDILLIYIYTGMRPTELLEVLTENVHLEERYMVGGLKTENGYNRLIPLCDKILPLVTRL